MQKKQLLIVYAGYSPIGSTATLAKWIADGASKYVNVVVKPASEATADDVANADGLILGSGTYNGNPEPAILEFADGELGAGKNEAVLYNKICGTFCTSAGYTTGAQPVLNALAKIAMTFGATFVGGGVWHTGQGVCGMVHDNKDGTWEWPPAMKYLQEDATSYGERLGMITSFFTDSYNKMTGSTPSPGHVIICNTTQKHYTIIWVLLLIVLVGAILLYMYRKLT